MNLDNLISERKNKKIYKDGDKVIKLFDKEFSKSDILNEALNQSRIEETKLSVPKILEVTTIDDKWAIVIEYVQGKTLDKLMEENPDKEDEYLDLFINIQKEIMSAKSPLLTKIKDKMRNKINSSNYDNAIKYELNARIEATPNHGGVCHGDFDPSNIIIRNDGSYSILDWSHVTQGYKATDVAKTYLNLSIAGKKELAEKYMTRALEVLDIQRQDVQRWIPVVAATQLLKNNPEEKEELESWINVLDYSM